MEENKKPDFDKQLGDSIQKALETGDFTQLKETLKPAIQNVAEKAAEFTGQIGQTISDAVTDAQKKAAARPKPAVPPKEAPRVPSRYTTNWQTPPPKAAAKAKKPRRAKKIPTKSEGWVGIFLGLIFGTVILEKLYENVLALLSGPFSFRQLPSVLIPGFFFCLCLSWIGSSGKKFRERRILLYQGAIGSEQVCRISRLAAAVGRSEKFVLRDLKRMIKAGLFPQGHFDEEKSLFIVTDDAYSQYLVGQANRKQWELQQARAKEDPDGLEAIMAEGEDWIRKIQLANNALPGQEISEKLSQLEQITGKIFACVEKHPEKIPEIRRFMNYYLPTTVKLVNSYREFEAQPVQGENIQTAKKEILDILDTVNAAFASLLDSLFQHDAIDISADISVLKTMLAREGLTEKDFPSK